MKNLIKLTNAIASLLTTPGAVLLLMIVIIWLLR